ncbi:MAG: Asp-tRNA(Asn)/Glu-tRNA(Gln) amidotransferase subunit GatB [Deltaproteobacteria bacterium]|jgi:aspartyl-tRNA(Asn)/glutamyl-tRNA(Gln) amidotransferase subunit B
MTMDYDVIICFETHVELKTKTKLFCDCAVTYDAPPNSHVCPVCTGQPGALPVLNKKAVEYAIRAGLALNCTVNRRSRFARKNYFYPDLPKGYQISQYERPFCQDGILEIMGDNGHPYPVGIKRIHLEEDAGKLVHSSSSFEASDYSLVDYNRACVPLLEIVGDHERNPIRSLQEARTYLDKLRQTLRYIDISDCSIEKGQFRCDVNVSLRPKGSHIFGNRAEVKNMASFKFIMEALEFEIERQAEVLRSGGELIQETRLFDEQKRITLPMRSKEDAPDYRYFPDPDLVEVDLDLEFIEKIRRGMPELPDQRVTRLVEEFGISKKEALLLTRDKHVADYFTACAALTQDKKRLSRWIINELFMLLKAAALPVQKCRISPRNLADFITLLAQGEITDKVGKSVLEEMFRKGVSPNTVIARDGYKAIHDHQVLKKILNEVFKENPEVVSQIREGKTKLTHYLIGQVMKKTQGKADPKTIRELIDKKLRS